MTETTQRTATGTWLILLAALLWGTTGTSQALAPAGAQPQAVGALRLAIGGAALMALALGRGGLGSLRSWLVPATIWGGGCIAVYQLAFFAAVARTGVAVGTMVAIGSSPVAAGLLGYLVRGERPGRRWLVATVLAVAGCLLLTASSGTMRVDLPGILLAVVAGASYAVYTLAIKTLLPGRSADGVVAVVFCAGALLLAPLLVTADLGWLANPRGIGVVLHLGLVATAVSYQLFARGLASVPVASAVTLSLAEPLTAALLGVTLLGERPTPAAFAGMGLIFAGLALLALNPRRK
jgi:DME family drug/metabolite transporter